MFGAITEKASLIFGNFEQKIDVIELDLVSSRTISEKVELTQNPVEGGFINDHARDQPTEIVISAVVSKYSIRFRNFAQANINLLTGKPTRLQSVHDQLYELKNKKEPIILKTPYKDYTNMILVSLDFNSDENTGEALRFTASFKEVKFATSQLVAIDNSKIKTQSAKKKTNLGRQTANPTEASIPTQPKPSEISLWQFISSPGGKF